MEAFPPTPVEVLDPFRGAWRSPSSSTTASPFAVRIPRVKAFCESKFRASRITTTRRSCEAIPASTSSALSGLP
jgi:hypothetical protein